MGGEATKRNHIRVQRDIQKIINRRNGAKPALQGVFSKKSHTGSDILEIAPENRFLESGSRPNFQNKLVEIERPDVLRILDPEP